MKRKVGLATASLLVAAAQPCFAADDMREFGSARRESAAFAGASVRLELGRGVRSRPTARLQLGVTQSYRDLGSAAPAQLRRVSGIELGASRSGQPRFFVGGEDVRAIERRLGLDGTTRTVLIVGGVLIVVVLVGLMSSGGDLGPCTSPGC